MYCMYGNIASLGKTDFLFFLVLQASLSAALNSWENRLLVVMHLLWALKHIPTSHWGHDIPDGFKTCTGLSLDFNVLSAVYIKTLQAKGVHVLSSVNISILWIHLTELIHLIMQLLKVFMCKLCSKRHQCCQLASSEAESFYFIFSGFGGKAILLVLFFVTVRVG